MEDDLIQYLLGLPALTNLVATRIYWLKRPQGEDALPTIIMTLFSSDSETRMDGPDGLIEASVQFDCYGKTISQTVPVKEALLGELEGARFIAGAYRFRGVFVETFRHATAEPPLPPELVRYSLDMRLWHRLN